MSTPTRLGTPVGILLASTALVAAAHAQQSGVQLDQLSVEAAGPGNSAPAPSVVGAGSNPSGGDGGTAATSGGGGPSGITGYTARVVTTATKTNTPLIEVPQSVSVITREQLNDRNVQTFTDAVNYVPGAISAR